MPNGGSDCCANCAFNSATEGEWYPLYTLDHSGDELKRNSTGVLRDRIATASSCLIRDGVPIRDPFWTYCANFGSRSTEATGPIYASGLYGDGYERIPWHGASEPNVGVPALCDVCGRRVEEGITVGVDRRTIVGGCSNDHYRAWWIRVHADETLLSPEWQNPWDAAPPDPAG